MEADTAVLARPVPDPTDASSAAFGSGATRPGPDDLTQLDLPPPPALSWHLAPAGPPYGDGAARATAEAERRQHSKPALIAAESWGETSLAFSANTAAGISYTFGWISGLLVYFNERENRFVRFHALQSVLFSAVSVAFGVLVSILVSIFFDLGNVTHSL